MANTYRAKLAEQKIINDRYYIPNFELIEPHRLDFKAGQYIIIKIPDTDQIRQYSICSEPEMNHAIQLLIDIKPGGAGSQYFSSLEIGQEIEFMAPAGRFVIEPSNPEEELVFIATGAGIAPFRSMLIDQLVTKQNKQKMRLFWGMRHQEDMFWEEEFFQMAKEHENFSVEMVLSQPSQSWNLSTGYVTDLLTAFQKEYDNQHFYVCGGEKMIASVISFLEIKGVDTDHIHKERFY